MLKIQDIRVRSMGHDYLQVKWDVAPTFEDVLDYSMRIMRSESPEGPYDYIGQPFVDKYEFFDHRVDIQTRQHRYWYYKIEATRLSTGETEAYGPSARSPKPDPIGEEIRRNALLVYTVASGRRCWVFQVRTTGQRCTSCRDPVDNQVTLSDCETCYGTGFVRGYLDPIEAYIQFDPSPKQVSTDLTRHEKVDGQTAHMGYYPELKPLDMIIEPENRRWIVRAVSATERLRAVVRQDIHLDEVPRGSVQFRVPVKLDDLMDQEFSNPWMFQPIRTLGEGISWK